MAKQVVYFEHYPHFLGTRNCTLVFTAAEFDKIITLAKSFIKTKGDGNIEVELCDFIDTIGKKQKPKQIAFAIFDALCDYGDSPRRPQTIVAALTKKGVWSGEWEEGSFAFAATEKKARDAVAKIEAKHVYDDF